MASIYVAVVGGHAWSRGPWREFRTIRECREWAESYGTTADWCQIKLRSGRVVGEHRRDTNGHGTEWFRASFTAGA
jgi:hypothetical protein